MASIFDTLADKFQNALIPSSVSKNYDYMMGLSKTDPQAFQAALKQPQLPTGDITSAMMGVMPIAGMAKQFKAGPDTVEGLINHLVDNNTILPGRKGMLPTIHFPTSGEKFKGEIGGIHPSKLAQEYAQRMGKAAGGWMFGWTPSYEGAPFLGEQIANQLSMEGGPAKIKKLLDKGISLSTITDMLSMGRQP